MKPQSQEHPALYRALSAQFEMRPEQMQRLEQKLRRHMAEAPQANARTPVRQPEGSPVSSRKPAVGAYWYAARIVPLAACLVLALTGGYLMLRISGRQPDAIQISSQELEEQTAPPETVPVTGTSQSGSAQHTESHTTAAPETQPSVQTPAPVTNDVTRPGSPQTAPPSGAAGTPVSAAVTTRTTTAPVHTGIAATTTAATTSAATTSAAATTTATTTTTTSATAAEPPLPDWGDAVIVIPDVYAKAGEEVTVSVVLMQDVTCGGMQYSGRITSPDIRLCEAAEIDSDLTEILAEFGESPTLNITEDAFYVVFGHAHDTELPAGTVLLRLRVRVPADAPAGTEYAFEPIGDERIKFAMTDGSSLMPQCYYGRIVVSPAD